MTSLLGRYGLAALLIAGLASPALAWDCALVRWGVKNLPKETLNNYLRSASPEQLAAGAKCFGDHRRKTK